MLLALLSPFLITSDSGPLGEALAASEAPKTLRAAFTVTLESDVAWQTYRYDPRLAPAQRWQFVEGDGEDSAIDRVAAEWGAEAAPDGRLFPDDLRASLGQTVEAEDLGGAWRIRFRHTPSANDTEIDLWAIDTLRAEAWLDPTTGRLLRIDHRLERPVPAPGGGRLHRYQQSHFLATEPTYGLSFISGFTVELEAGALMRREERSYRARITEAEFFFASAADEARFRAARGTGATRQPRPGPVR